MSNSTTSGATNLPTTTPISSPSIVTTTPSPVTTPSLPPTSATTPSQTPSQTPPSTSVSIVSQTPSTTFVAAPTTTPSVAIVSSTVLVTSATDGPGGPTIVTITSTQNAVTITPSNTQPVSNASSSPSASILGASGSRGDGSSGLSTSGKIAIAVIIPIVVIAVLFLFGLFLWKKRRTRKSAEEQQKMDTAEYGYNPNNDPSLVPIGGAYTDGGSEADDGYRGWGTTSSNPRKPSTTLGSNSRAPNGQTYSDTTSQPGNYGYQGSPNGHASEHWSGDPLIGGHNEGIDGITALGGAAAVGGAAATLSARNNRHSGVQRGPSNASSTYSHNPPHSESSSDAQGGITNYYQEEVPYNIYNDVAPSHGPYGDGSYGAGATDQPVIRDVQARRNTRIERVPTFPQTQGGISQNF